MNQSRWADTPPPPEDVPSNDFPPNESFAQTGPQEDDLFDDIVPAAESMRLRSDEDLFNDDFTPISEPVVEEATQSEPPLETPIATTPAPKPQGHTDSPRGRDRGRGRGGHANNNGANGHRRPPAQAQKNAPENAPTGPRKETTAAVRGDRQATGGVKKPKLSEKELEEKLASMQIKNASIAAAHARAEADAASFAEREQQAKHIADQKRKEELRDRQQMMNEREKNRQRKLKAMTGREWNGDAASPEAFSQSRERKNKELFTS